MVAPRQVHAIVTRELPEEGHERATHQWIARNVAELLRVPYAGEAMSSPPADSYFVPDETLEDEAAERLGIVASAQLLGGVVPHAFLATKAVAHPLVEGAKGGMPGWNVALSRALVAHTLPGYTAFAAADARQAYSQLARAGPVRLKLPTGVGGRGQWLLEDAAMLDVVLAGLPADYLARHGIVLETHLVRLQTFSVGEVDCAGLSIAYHGTQVSTRARDGAAVYGGSDLEVMRGTLEDLLDEPLPPLQRQAVQAARAFDRALRSAWPQLRLSRRNYDVACGEDAQGLPWCGVLEQSWRIGGATPAELAALAAFAADPALRRVRAATRELHGLPAPAGVEVYYDAADPRLGPLVKYVTVAPA